MTNTQDTLKNRLQHAQCLIDTFLSAEMNERIRLRLADGLLFSLQELLEQAQAALQEICQQRKPDASENVKFDREELSLTLNEALELASASNDLIQCARADLRGQPNPSKSPVEPIRELEKERLTLIRELTKQSADVAKLGRSLLEALDRRDKAA